jgi:hypothetical protein
MQKDKEPLQKKSPKKRPIGLYIIATVFIVMVLFYLVYVNGFLGS